MIARRTLDVHRLPGRFGAEVSGLGRSAEPTHGEVTELYDALLRHKVLGLRGLHLDAAGHRRLVARFGSVVGPGRAGGPTATLRQPASVPSFARWVTEGSHLLAPPRIVSLQASSPDVTGECTLLADVDGAYRDLPAPLRALADRSWATHGDATAEHPPDDLVAHPVTRLHPETGDRGLLLGGHARRLIGLTEGESRTVVHLLQSYLVRPHNVLRWDWREGDVLLFDARSVQHHTRPGVRREPGTTTALAVAGDPPLGVDGRHSHLVRPDTFTRRSA